MNNAADEIVILSDALEALRLRTEELEQKLDTTAQPLAAASVALGGALDGIKALQFHVRDSNLGTLSGRIEELRASVAEKIEAFSTQLVDADKRLESEQRQNVDGLRVELGAIGSAVAAISKKFDSELARIETDAKAEFSRIEQIKLQVGPEGRSLNPRGTFVDGETYNRLDVVSWLGSSYIAAVDGVTEKPSRNSNQWQVLASRGGGAGGVGDFASLAGVAQINQGGTGQTTRAAALNALLPSQTGATQYVLLTDGSGNVSWGAQPVAGLPSQTSNGGKLLTTDGTNASWSGAVTVSGSNATVAGTLSSGGNLSVTSTSAQVILGQSSGSQLSYLIRPAQAGGAIQIVQDSATTARYLSLGRADNNGVYVESMRLNDAGVVSIPATTASTSTSTGALVVSGGVGVAGTIYAGGTIRVVGSSHTTRFRQDDAIIDFNNTAENAYVTGTISGNTLQLKGNNGTGLTIGTTGNATFAGTLTVSAGSLVVDHVGSSSPTLSLSANGSVQSRFFANGSNTFLESYTNTPLILRTNQTTALTITTGQQVQVNATTASTSTSTGALVVSGGVGVAGAINVGGNATVTGTLTLGAITTPRGKLDSQQTYNGAAPSTSATPIIRANNGGAISLWTCGQGYDAMWLQAIQDDGANLSKSLLINPLGSNVELGSTSSQVLVKGTTASTSTSTGALVVSGGVGVGGAIYAGGNIVNTTGTDFSSVATSLAAIHTVSSAPRLTLIRSSSSANNKLFDIINNSDGQVTFRFVNDDLGGATSALQLTKTSATVVGSLQTGAPSGGTAAAWKLGTVASVSPTSPNRTIEVDIGGTIYYIHAKTTNN